MYETKKQVEMANIAIKTFYWNQEKYDSLANSLLFDIEEEKKTKLTNYIKILCMSSSIKNKEATNEFEIKNIPDSYKHFNAAQTNYMCELLLAIFISLELSIFKSKELKTDLRSKLIEELANVLEVNNKDLARVCHRALTEIIER